MKTKLIIFIMNLLFYRSPKISFSEQEIDEYNLIFNDAINRDGLINYTSQFSKQRFIQYIASNKNVLLHGSNNKMITEFEPRRQTLYNGKYVNAVFATKDGLWPVFYAILDKTKVSRNIRNGCLETINGNKFYFFSLTQETYLNNPWTNGMIYFVPHETFTKASNEIVSFDEWISKEPVRPIAKLVVDWTDFYFLNRITIHHYNEPIIKTWLLYKWRNTFGRFRNKTDKG